MIDITITATKRSEILERTLTSFKEKLFKYHEVRIIINVDPVGPDNGPWDCINLCTNIFKEAEVIWRTPDVPNFSDAFRWTWGHVTSEYVFHLEDDWELLVDVELSDLTYLFYKYNDLVSIRLPQFPSAEDTMKNWNLFFPWNGDYFECPDELRVSQGFCGHPSLIRREFVRAIAPHINTNLNPEKQLHHGPPKIIGEVSRWQYGVFGKPNQGPYIRDLGRAWAVESGWHKKGNKAHFLEWEKV